jgi:condensin complex subunit 1
MEVDGEEESADEPDEDDDDDVDERSIGEPADAESVLDDDDNGDPKTPRRNAKGKKKAKAKKAKAPRKSELDMSALTNEQAALAALEGNQLLHLRLRKKYYAEALNFIKLIEGAMDTIGLLLGSTNKAEVLQAMDFLRVAYEYKFDGAKVRFLLFLPALTLNAAP